MYKVVFDTNVFLSALIKNQGVCAQFFSTQFQSSYVLITSKMILKELKAVGEREYFRRYFEVAVLYDFIREIIRNAIIVKIDNTSNHFIFTDSRDKAVYDSFISSSADYLVTGNLRHFPTSNKIIQPGEFLEKLRS